MFSPMFYESSTDRSPANEHFKYIHFYIKIKFLHESGEHLVYELKFQQNMP